MATAEVGAPGTRGRWAPALVLFLLAPVCGELLSGSAPPAEFFHPVGFLLLVVLYGGGALIARELCVIWRKGFASLLLLGAAYGIVEEGLMVKSFFDPAWQDLGALGVHGRWLWVNWVWSLSLTLYHAVVSIAIPVLLVELCFPGYRDRRWLGRRSFAVLSLLFLADGVLIYVGITPYRPPALLYVSAVLVTAGLVGLAWRWPAPAVAAEEPSRPAPRPLAFLLVGFVGMLGLFAGMGGLPRIPVPAFVTMLGLAAWATLIAVWVRSLSRGGRAWDDRHRLALASGALGLFVLLAPLQELDASRPDNTTGMALVGLAALVFLVLLRRRVDRRSRADPGSTRGPAGWHRAVGARDDPR